MNRILIVFLCLLLVGCRVEDKEVSSTNVNYTYNQVSEYFDRFAWGDIICLENSHYLSNLVIPGRWKHSLIYLGTYKQVISHIDIKHPYYHQIMNKFKTKEEVLILDANESGVKIRCFDEMANLKKDSYLKALICYRIDRDQVFIDSFVNNALGYLGRAYDFEMNSKDDKELYCSELIYWSLKKLDINISYSTKLFKYNVISPTDVIKSLKNDNLIKKVILLE